MKAVSRIGAGLLLAALCSCQASQDQERFFRYDHDRWTAGEKTASYFKDVFYDFCDIFTLDIGWGKTANGAYHAQPWTWGLAHWFAFNVHVTKYAELGYGNWAGYKAGMLGRGMGIWREERYDGGFSLLLIQNYSVHMTRVPSRGNGQLATKYADFHGYNIDLDQHHHWADLGVSLYFFILPGFDINVSPFEALDFALGLLNNYPNPVEMTGAEMPWDIGTDIADDDTRPSIYDNKLGKNRYSDYSIWPTIWPTTFGHHEEMEGEEALRMPPPHTPRNGSVGGAYGGDKARH
jgi:hypothetical protein